MAQTEATLLNEVTQTQVYMIVCTDFHMCVGPYKKLSHAVQAAKQLTEHEADGCSYVPVPLVGLVISGKPGSTGKSSDDDGHPGMYL